jgi:hypothetical protein
LCQNTLNCMGDESLMIISDHNYAELHTSYFRLKRNCELSGSRPSRHQGYRGAPVPAKPRYNTYMARVT